MIYFNVILINIICVLVIDFSGIMDSLDSLLNRYLNTKSARVPKPFSCSKCMTFWLGLGYLFFVNSLTLFFLAYLLLVSVCSDITYQIILTVKLMVMKGIEALQKLLKLN